MNVKELAEESNWFYRTFGEDLNVRVFDKTLGVLTPTGLDTRILECEGRGLCLLTDVVGQGGFTDQLATALFDSVIRSSEMDSLLEKQLQEDFGSYEFKDKLSAVLIGVVGSEEFLKVLREKLKL